MTTQPGAIDDDWIAHHFDHLSPELARDLHPTLARARDLCPVARSDRYEGFLVATRYEDVLRVAQDWETFSSELGITVPGPPPPNEDCPAPLKILPVGVDPPLQREFKRLINAYFTPRAIEDWEVPTRALVNRLIDNFISAGRCDFMGDFARPFPGLAFFDLALHAPADDLEQVNEWATNASLPQTGMESIAKLADWIRAFVNERRVSGPVGDVVDGVLAAEIEGRPITEDEAIGTIQLLILGGLETTAGVLGMGMLRFCQEPEIPALLRERPELIPAAVEELLRLDGSFICIARTARDETDVAGHPLAAGERVLLYWASANRDPAEFEDPETFDATRTRNRHIAFGAGPHRCAGSNLARLNLRIALEEILGRMADFRLDPGADIDFHSTFNRAPRAVPISFRAL